VNAASPTALDAFESCENRSHQVLSILPVQDEYGLTVRTNAVSSIPLRAVPTASLIEIPALFNSLAAAANLGFSLILAANYTLDMFISSITRCRQKGGGD